MVFRGPIEAAFDQIDGVERRRFGLRPIDRDGPIRQEQALDVIAAVDAARVRDRQPRACGKAFPELPEHADARRAVCREVRDGDFRLLGIEDLDDGE